jgi:hypothetical protein
MSVAAHFQSTPASVDVLRQGQVRFELAADGGTATVVVPDAAITVNSMVVLSGIGTNATALVFTVELNAGVGFTIRTGAAATVAAKLVNFSVLKY